jgi:hypothetical protein
MQTDLCLQIQPAFTPALNLGPSGVVRGMKTKNGKFIGQQCEERGGRKMKAFVYRAGSTGVDGIAKGG